MGFFKQLLGGTAKLVVSPLAAVSGIIDGEPEEVGEAAELGATGIVDILTSPAALFDDDDD